MKKMAAFVIAVLFAASTIPAFAAEQPARENNLFKIIADSFKKPLNFKEKDKLKNPLPTVTVFQNAADGIKTGSEKAKAETLRTK